MLIILIPSVWLALMAFFVVLCRGAAHADADALVMSRVPSRSTAERSVRTNGALVLFQGQRGRVPRQPRLGKSGPSKARGVRGRGGRCVAGS
jgi:hypothetical protein